LGVVGGGEVSAVDQEPTAFEEALDASMHQGDELADLLGARRSGGVEHGRSAFVGGQRPIQHESMKM
jgi:hypothetical protein